MMKMNPRLHHLALIVPTACLMVGVVLSAQSSRPSSSQAAPSQSAQVSPPSSPIALDGSATLHHLNEVIRWYRNCTTSAPAVGLPSDAIYQYNMQSLGSQAVQLAFQSAKAESAIMAAQKNGGGGQEAAAGTQAQTLAQTRVKTSAQIDQLQSQIEILSAQIEKTPASRRANLSSQREALQSELELQKTFLDANQKMSAFVENNGEIAGGLEGEINQLARSIPEVLGSAASAQKPATAQASAPSKPSLANSGGLISEALTLHDHVRAMHQIDELVKETSYTRDLADHLRTPLRNALRATVQQGQQLANQPLVSDSSQLQAQRKNFEQLTGSFKQLSGALLPLSQEIIVLDESKTNFNEWRNSISRETRYVLRSLLVRVVGLAFALGVVLLLSDVWRRVTFRYVSDPRRRRQFLVLRRVVTGFLVAVVYWALSASSVRSRRLQDLSRPASLLDCKRFCSRLPRIFSLSAGTASGSETASVLRASPATWSISDS
jgi:hypothetical protein